MVEMEPVTPLPPSVLSVGPLLTLVDPSIRLSSRLPHGRRVPSGCAYPSARGRAAHRRRRDPRGGRRHGAKARPGRPISARHSRLRLPVIRERHRDGVDVERPSPHRCPRHFGWSVLGVDPTREPAVWSLLSGAGGRRPRQHRDAARAGSSLRAPAGRLTQLTTRGSPTWVGGVTPAHPLDAA